ncbi:hypothetical protein D3C85_874630 [compost metagenome]
MGQRAMGGAHQRKIHRHRPRRAQRRHFARLQHAQQTRLQQQRHIADFVQEQHPAVRLAQQALAALAARAGKGAVLVAKQFGFDQAFGQRRAIDGHERPRRALAARMQFAGKHFLAHAGLALQQNRHARVRQMHGTRQCAQRGGVEAGRHGALGLGGRLAKR